MSQDRQANEPRQDGFGAGGRYAIRRELGRGTMGVVYEAEDTVLGRTVAVKTIELAFGVGEDARRPFEQRFFTEARVAAKLSHPGIVVCHDVGKDPASGKLFIVFEHLKGRTLADRVARGPVPWREAVEIAVKLARAIHHAHEHGVVHRDLKPANVMLLETDDRSSAATAIKIMDFGVARLESAEARLTKTGEWFGSPLYMSPEQALGRPSDARSDIFSLGSLLCTLLLGKPWFDGANIPAILQRVVHEDAPPLSILVPGVPTTLDPIVARAMAKRPDDRYASGAAMGDDLEDVLSGRLPRSAGAATQPPLQAADAEALLAHLVPAASEPSRAGSDPTDALASLVDDAAAASPAGAGAATRAATEARRSRWRPWAAGLTAVALMTAAVLVWRERARRAAAVAVVDAPAFSAGAPLPSSPPGPVPTAAIDPAAATPGPTPSALAAPTPSPATGILPATAPTGSPEPPRPTEPAVERRAEPQRRPQTESPRQAAPGGPALADVPRPATVARLARMKITVEHPFESGRLIVWVDGILAFETKLRAEVSRRIVGVKVREGRVETMLDVTPGRHEVRVEARWNDERRVGTTIADVAAASTGLLEVRFARITRDLRLEWSRLSSP